MSLLPDGLYIAWSAAGGFATLALATGGRAIFTQWRANASSSRQAEDWTTITDATSAFCSGDEESAGIVLRALSRPSSQRIAIEALANLARVDARVPESLRGRTEMVEEIRSWVSRELAHSDAGRRCAGAEIVGALRLRACRGAVALATSDDEPEVRVAACRALAVVDPDHAVGVLLGLVERDGVWAADLLADIVSREDGAFSGSEAVVQRANEWAATPALLRLLSNGHIAGAERVMIGALDAEDDDVRASAAEALRESGTPDAIKALAGLLGDSNELIRLTAVRAIGQSADPSYSMDLAAMLGDESRLVRFAAGAALAGLASGRDLLLRATEGTDAKAVEAAHVSLWQAEQSAQLPAVAPVDGPGPLSQDELRIVDLTTRVVPLPPTRPSFEATPLAGVDRLIPSPPQPVTLARIEALPGARSLDAKGEVVERVRAKAAQKPAQKTAAAKKAVAAKRAAATGRTTKVPRKTAAAATGAKKQTRAVSAPAVAPTLAKGAAPKPTKPARPSTAPPATSAQPARALTGSSSASSSAASTASTRTSKAKVGCASKSAAPSATSKPVTKSRAATTSKQSRSDSKVDAKTTKAPVRRVVKTAPAPSVPEAVVHRPASALPRLSRFQKTAATHSPLDGVELVSSVR